MNEELRPPDVPVDETPVVYRVRVWTPPPRPGFAWAVDDWEIRDAPNVGEVVEWGIEKADGRTFEVLARGADPTFVRVYGAPAADTTTVVTVELTTPD